MPDDIREMAEQDTSVLRQQIDVTRSSITEKLEALEDQVVGTVQDARDSMQDTIDTVKESVEATVTTVKETVQDTIGSVKETMEETVNSVKDTFDVRRQVLRHPWPMMGGSFVAGLLAGALFGEVQHRRRMPMDRLASHGEPPRRASAPPPIETFREERPAPRQPGMMDKFRDEIDEVKGVAIGMAIGLVRDLIKDAVQERMPQMADQVENVIDRITTKLGGKPVQGHVLHDEHPAMATRS